MHVRVASPSQPSDPSRAVPRAKTSSRILVEGDKNPQRSGWHYGHATDDTTLSRRDELVPPRNVPVLSAMDQSPWAPPAVPAQYTEPPVEPQRPVADAQIGASTLTINRKTLERVRKQRQERLTRTAPSMTLARSSANRNAPVPPPPPEATSANLGAVRQQGVTQPATHQTEDEGRGGDSSAIKWEVTGTHPTDAGAVPPVRKAYVSTVETSSPRIVDRFAFDGVIEETVRLVSSYVPSRSVLRQPRQRATRRTTIQHVPGNRALREAARRAINGEAKQPASPAETESAPTMQMRAVTAADLIRTDTTTEPAPAAANTPQHGGQARTPEPMQDERALPAQDAPRAAGAQSALRSTPPVPPPPASAPVPPPPVPQQVPVVIEDPAVTTAPSARVSRARHSRLDPESQRLRALLGMLTVTVLLAFGVVIWQSHTQYGPALTAQHVADRYVTALAEGRAESAYELEPHKGLPILTDATYRDITGRPTEYTLGMLKKEGDTATVSVTWRDMDGTKRSSISLVRDEAGPFGLVPQWRITKGLSVPVALTVQSSSIHDSVAQIDISDSGTYVRATDSREGTVVSLFPGTYSFEVSHSARYADFGEAQDLVVAAEPNRPIVVSFSERPSELLLQDAREVAQDHLRDCMNELSELGCPNRVEELGVSADQVSEFRWTTDSLRFVLAEDGARLNFSGTFVLDYTYAWRGGIFGGAQVWAGSDDEPIWDEQREIEVNGSWRINTLGEKVALVFE
ncbi:hypothetical protein ACFSYH_09410 [Populibacterium corticicola]|uniref:Uncharacterized protein n=1 Tax=Populibacterium corticicola TaxID=1812826 RepID=A0ABW5XF96_9MICO